MGEGCCFAFCCPGALLGLRIKLRVQENIQVGSPTVDSYFVRRVERPYSTDICKGAKALRKGSSLELKQSRNPSQNLNIAKHGQNDIYKSSSLIQTKL